MTQLPRNKNNFRKNSVYFQSILAHILDVKFNFGASEHRVEVPSQKPVNDSRWHKVLIESINGHLRFSLDDQNSFHKLSDNENLDQKTFTENFYIGSNPKCETVRKVKAPLNFVCKFFQAFRWDRVHRLYQAVYPR